MKLKRTIDFFIRDRKYFYNQVRQKFYQKINYLYDFSGRSFSINTLWLVLTYRCNLSCRMCGQWGEEGRSRNLGRKVLMEDLPVSVLKDLVDEVKKYFPKIILVGGEPFLYNGWDEIARYIKENGIRCEITTNGMLLSKFSKTAVDVFDCINVSLDGDRTTNDSIRGKEGGFRTVLDGIRDCLRIKKNNKPFINICCTICEKNFDKLEKLIDEIEEEKIEIDTLLFQHLEFVDSEMIEKTSQIWKEKFDISADYWRGICRKTQKVMPDILFDQICKIKKRKPVNIKFIMFKPDLSKDELINYYLYPQNMKYSKKICFSPYLEAFVYPDGNVWTCPGLVMGNIKDDKFTDIWNGSKYILLRKTIRKIKRFPICIRCANYWHS